MNIARVKKRIHFLVQTVEEGNCCVYIRYAENSWFRKVGAGELDEHLNNCEEIEAKYQEHIKNIGFEK